MNQSQRERDVQAFASSIRDHSLWRRIIYAVDIKYSLSLAKLVLTQQHGSYPSS
jgi:hypothetical protein